ncbi:MAG: shikimate dehydrogenase [Clostridia bacterium]|nr:shikimate dehydrogenase [Clostridia bacterium]
MDKIKLGLIGNPLGHSVSPQIHNLICKSLNMECQYEKTQLEESEIENYVSYIKQNNFAGFNITIPYKQKIMEHLDFVDSFAKKCNAVNTVCCKDNKLYGYNTDGEGFYLSLKNLNLPVEDKKISILGCGGAAMGIIFKLLEENCHSINIFCRDILKADKIKNYMPEKINVYNMNDSILNDIIKESDILINTTPLGMKNFGSDFDNFSFIDNFEGVLCDIVYNPIETNLLKNGKKRGLITVGGLHMLINQGILAFERFSSVELSKKELSDRIYKEIKKIL